jgi:hypothetical protein
MADDLAVRVSELSRWKQLFLVSPDNQCSLMEDVPVLDEHLHVSTLRDERVAQNLEKMRAKEIVVTAGHFDPRAKFHLVAVSLRNDAIGDRTERLLAPRAILVLRILRQDDRKVL